MTTTAMDIGQKELPAGWKWVKLGDVCDASSGSTPSRNIPEYWDGDIAWAKIQDISAAGKWITTTGEQITQSAFSQTSVKLFPENTVLIAMYGASIGKTCITAKPMTTNQAILGCICNENTVPDFLWYWIRITQEDLIAMGQGGAQPNVNAGIIKDLDFPLPPLEEQKRIAGILDEQMAAVEEAKKAAQQRLEAAKALPDAYLREVFEGEEAKGWETEMMSEICERISGGSRESTQGGYVASNGIPFLRTQNIKRFQIDWENVLQISREFHSQLKSTQLHADDLLVVRVGASAGTVAVVPPEFKELNCADLLFARPLTDRSLSRFLMYAISAPATQALMQTLTVGSIHQKYNTRTLHKLVVPVPSLSDQNRVVREVEDKLAGVKLAEASIQQELDTIEAMPAALLRKAFSGNL